MVCTELLTFQRNLGPPQGERERDTDIGKGGPYVGNEEQCYHSAISIHNFLKDCRVKTTVEGKALNVSETQEHNKGILYFALKHTKTINQKLHYFLFSQEACSECRLV